MSNTPTEQTETFVVLDTHDTVVETDVSQVEAFRLIDWMTVNDRPAAPFRCVPLQREATR